MTTRAPAGTGRMPQRNASRPQRARRDHARAIVVAERQVLIVGARRVEGALRAHAHEARPRSPPPARRRWPSRARRPPERSRWRSRSRPRARRRRARRRPASPRGRCRRARRAASHRGRSARRKARPARPARRGRSRARRRGRPGRRRSRTTSTISSVVTVAGASVAGSVPEPPISRTIFRNSALPARLPVISVWWSMPSREQPVGGGEHVDVGAGERVLALAGQPVARGHHAGPPVRPAVDAHAAGRAVPVEAEEAPRPVVLGRPPQRADAGGEQRRRRRARRRCAGTGVPSKSIATGSPAGGTPANPRRVGFTRDNLTQGREQPSVRAALPFAVGVSGSEGTLSDFDDRR